MADLFDDTAPFLIESLYPRFASAEDPIDWRMKHHLRPSGHTALDVRWWLLSAIKEWNLKPTNLAKAAGIAPSTLNKFIESKDDTKNLNASTINKLSAALKLEVYSLKRSIIEEEFPIENVLYADRQIAQAMILGDASCREWRAPETYDPAEDPEDDPHWYVRIPVIRPYFQIYLAAFDVGSRELEPVFNRGDLLICAPVSRLERPPAYGSYVIAHEVSATGAFRNSVMTSVTDPAGHHWLMPVGSSDATPIYSNLAQASRNRTKVTFAVIGRVSNTPDLP